MENRVAYNKMCITLAPLDEEEEFSGNLPIMQIQIQWNAKWLIYFRMVKESAVPAAGYWDITQFVCHTLHFFFAYIFFRVQIFICFFRIFIFLMWSDKSAVENQMRSDVISFILRRLHCVSRLCILYLSSCISLHVFVNVMETLFYNTENRTKF